MRERWLAERERGSVPAKGRVGESEAGVVLTVCVRVRVCASVSARVCSCMCACTRRPASPIAPESNSGTKESRENWWGSCLYEFTTRISEDVRSFTSRKL